LLLPVIIIHKCRKTHLLNHPFVLCKTPNPFSNLYQLKNLLSGQAMK
jgi:hypothetical protein